MLIDWHLRAETASDALVSALILDITDAEAANLLTVLELLGVMAGADAGKVDALLREVETDSEARAGLADRLADDSHGLLPTQSGKSGWKPPTSSAISEVRQTLSAEFRPGPIAAGRSAPP